MKKRVKIPHSPYEILQYISFAPFEKIALANVFLNNENQDLKELKSI